MRANFFSGASVIFMMLVVCQDQAKSQTIDSAYLNLVYRFEYKPDTTNLNVVKEDRLEMAIGKKYTKYSSYYTRIADSIIASNDGGSGFNVQKASASLKGMPVGSRKIILRNIATNVFTIIDKLGSDVYRYVDSMPRLKWKILPDSSILSGYSCRKALTSFRGRSYEAWFTAEISIPVGPFLFGGLPGLIIKVHEVKDNFNFTLEVLTNLNEKKPISIVQQKSKAVSRSQYRKVLKSMYSDIDAFAASQGMVFKTQSVNGDPDAVPPRRIPFNPIELE